MIVFAVLFSAGFLVIISIFNVAENRKYDISITDMNEGWTDSAGNKAILSGLPKGESDLKADVSGVDLTNMRFCTKSVDTYFDVWADGERIYSYRYIQSGLTGCSYGMNMHMIPVPEGTNVLRLKLTPVFGEEAPLLVDPVIADPGMYMGDFFSHGLLNFCLCIIIFIIGVSTIVLGMCGIMKDEFVSLGLFACFTALWSVNDTMFLQIITQKPEIIRALSYIAFALIPFPPVAFISKITGVKNRMPLVVAAALVAIHLVSTVVFAASGLVDFHYSVHISRILIVAAMIMCIIMTISALRQKNLNKKLLATITIGVGCAVAGAVTDLVRYMLTESVIQGVGLYTRLGIFVFMLVFTVYIITDYSRVRVESGKAEIMEKLAYIDALTGLNNRLAFNEKEIALKADGRSENCVIVQLDINNLKVVNDVYGHNEGDRHIRAAADIIQKSFEDFGICYRTGGDEFITVISPCGALDGAKAAVEKMLALSDEYNEKENPPVKLQIAYSYALCRDASKELEITELLADQRMYDCKQRMKAAAPINKE